MDGQAEAPESGGLSDLAAFLDTPEEEESTEETEAAEESTAESDTETEADGDSVDGDEPEEATTAEKITVKVKGEDGTEESLELTPDEIAASYLRQKDYTRKTQALAARETEAVQFLKTKHDEIRNQYLSQAELNRAAVVQMAGIKSESELAELAQADPAAWVAETQRQRQISAYLSQLDQQINGEKQRAAQEAEQQRQQFLKQQYAQAWEVLGKEKIDRDALAKIYGDASKTYGFTNDELGNVYDPRLVKMMRDATAYQQLKASKSTVTQKVSAAPKMPQRQSSPIQERKAKELDNRFKGGRAKLSDLAAYLNS